MEEAVEAAARGAATAMGGTMHAAADADAADIAALGAAPLISFLNLTIRCVMQDYAR